LAHPDGPAHLPTIWGSKDQRWHRGHLLLQSETPAVPYHSRDSLAEVSSICNVDRLYATAGLQDALVPPRKPENHTRQVIRIGLPKAETTAWISNNQLLQHHPELATEAAAILSSAPPWLQECAIHAKLDPVLGRCSWEENSSLCIRFRQTHNTTTPFNIDRARIRFRTCEMLNKLQHRCWPNNDPFKIDEINFIGYFAHSPAEHKRLEGMITIEYRHHIPLEQDLHVSLLLAMHIDNDIPTGEAGSGLKWCPIRNEIAHTSCTVTRVSARRSTRGHCRQDIPLGIYDRKQQRWTLKGKTDEIAYLLKLAGKSEDSSMIILDKIRSDPWNSKSPNLRIEKDKCEHRATQCLQIPHSPNVSPAIPTQRVGQYPEHRPGLAYAHMVSIIRG
jgi:hypothetical protein